MRHLLGLFTGILVLFLSSRISRTPSTPSSSFGLILAILIPLVILLVGLAVGLLLFTSQSSNPAPVSPVVHRTPVIQTPVPSVPQVPQSLLQILDAPQAPLEVTNALQVPQPPLEVTNGPRVPRIQLQIPHSPSAPGSTLEYIERIIEGISFNSRPNSAFTIRQGTRSKLMTFYRGSQQVYGVSREPYLVNAPEWSLITQCTVSRVQESLKSISFKLNNVSAAILELMRNLKHYLVNPRLEWIERVSWIGMQDNSDYWVVLEAFLGTASNRENLQKLSLTYPYDPVTQCGFMGSGYYPDLRDHYLTRATLYTLYFSRAPERPVTPGDVDEQLIGNISLIRTSVPLAFNLRSGRHRIVVVGPGANCISTETSATFQHMDRQTALNYIQAIHTLHGGNIKLPETHILVR